MGLKEQQAALQMLRDLPDQLQLVRDEISDIHSDMNGRVNQCHDKLNSLATQVEEAIRIFRLASRTKSKPFSGGIPPNQAVLPPQSSLSPSDPLNGSHSQNPVTPLLYMPPRKNPQGGKGEEYECEEFPKLPDILVSGVFHGMERKGKKGETHFTVWHCFCGKACDSFRKMHKHYFTATQERKFKCQYCSTNGSDFLFPRQLMEHCMGKHKLDWPVLPCCICLHQFLSREEYDAHTKTTETECGRRIGKRMQHGDPYYFNYHL